MSLVTERQPARSRASRADPDWLTWTRELQAIARTGLAFEPNGCDREHCETLRALASRIMAAHTSEAFHRIETLFAAEQGYATPKVDVRGAVFDADCRLLMVREIADGDRWTAPGGWADVNLTAAENVVKEAKEESGHRVKVRTLAAAWDRTRQGHPSGVLSCCKLFCVCDIVGGVAETGPETSDVRWFSENELPHDLSLGRVLPGQLRRMFIQARDSTPATGFDGSLRFAARRQASLRAGTLQADSARRPAAVRPSTIWPLCV